MTDLTHSRPDRMVSVREVFGIDTDLKVPAFSETEDHVPDIDPAYRFNPDVTLALLAGFSRDRRVMVQGLHGTGKSTHIEYDAGRPDVMFVIQRLLERDGKFTLMDQNRVLRPHPYFRLFATANTVGLGNLSGMYHGAQRLNHAQIDRWNIFASLNYLPRDEEVAIVQARVPHFGDAASKKLIESMVAVADLTRKGFAAGDLSTLMSPRTVITWAENAEIFRDPAVAFRLSFLNKCDEAERPIVAEYFQRCFNRELDESYALGAGAAAGTAAP